MKSAIVIPTYCEAENIGPLLEKIDKNHYVDLVIVVDDNSPDGTVSIVKDHKPENFDVALIKRRHRLGVGSARRDGIKVALERGCNYIVTMDADNHEPAFIPQLLAKSEEGYDLVIGSRYIDGGNIINWNWRRKLISKIANVIAQKVLRLNVKDCTSGFRCFSRRLAEKIVFLSKTKSSEFQQEVLCLTKKFKYLVTEVPITFVGRRKGKSKFTPRTMLRFLSHITNTALPEFRGKSLTGLKRVCVLGLGHVGVPNATAFAIAGHDVIGIDVKEDIVKSLNFGKLPFNESRLVNALRYAVHTGRFKATTDHSVMRDCDIIIVCIVYPPDNPKTFFHAIKQIGQNLKRGHLIVVRSSTRPGTVEEVAKVLEETSGLKRESDFFLAHCPERSVEGKILEENQTLPRIIGGIGPKSTALSVEFFKTVGKGRIIMVSNTKTAELLKLMENAWRATRFAYANEIGLLAEHWGVDAFEVIKAATIDYPRNSGLATPGLVGGPCIVKDSHLLVSKEQNPDLILAAQMVNEYVLRHVTDLVERQMKESEKKPSMCKVAVLGLAFKRGCDDVRNSPSIALIEKLKSRGFAISVYDPYVDKNAKITDVVRGCDAMVLAINHPEFENLSLEYLASLAKPRCAFVDCWGIHDAEKVERLGMVYIGLGRGASILPPLGGENSNCYPNL